MTTRPAHGALFNHLRTLIHLLLACLLFSGCGLSPNYHAGGSTTETTNGITVSLHYPDQTPAAGLTVNLTSSDHHADPESNPGNALLSLQTDASGTVTFNGLSPGLYTLSTLTRDSALGWVAPGVIVGEEFFGKEDTLVKLEPALLQTTGCLLGVRIDSTDADDTVTVISLRGTPYTFTLQRPGTFLLERLPPATYQMRLRSSRGATFDQDDVTVRSGDTTHVAFFNLADSISYQGSRTLDIVSSALVGDLTEYPLLVRFNAALPADSAVLHTTTLPGSLRFQDSSGTWLPFAIERWDSTTDSRSADVWLKVPVIYQSTGSGPITLFYGAAGRGVHDLQATSRVFDRGQGVSAVWHAHRSDLPFIYDATANNFSGTKKTVDEPLSTQGIIGYGQRFDGVDDYIDLGQDHDFIQGSARISLSAWILPQSGGGTVVDIGTGTDSSGVVLGLTSSGTLFLAARAADGDLIMAQIETPLPLALQSWSLICGVVDFEHGSLSLYVNGELAVAAPARFSASGAQWSHSRASYMGCRRGVEYFFSGMIDECRIWRAALNNDWMRMDYLSQKADAAVVTIR